VGDRPRGRFATPADSPRQDCSPYSQVHVRRDSLGFVHRSRSLFCRPRAKPWPTLRFVPVLRCLQNTTTQRTPQGCGRARSTGTLSGETASAPHPRRVLACPVTPPRTRDTVHACVTEKSTQTRPAAPALQPPARQIQAHTIRPLEHRVPRRCTTHHPFTLVNAGSPSPATENPNPNPEYHPFS
jgi:hypothetical protein